MSKSILFVITACILGVGSMVGYWLFRKDTPQSAVAETEVSLRPIIIETPPETTETPTKSKSHAAKPAIISRQEWKAKGPNGQGKEHTINCITIHHTGVPQKIGTTIEKKLQGLQAYSQSEAKLASGKTKPAWLDVPYHFYISVDGKIGEGRQIKYVSDTNTEYDPTRHATIVVEGNFETEEPTDAQLQSLQALVAWLTVEYQVPSELIKSHNDYARTLCPGVNLKKTIPALQEKITELNK